ncbi:MAG: protein phosphatase 2C domain-containing protein [Panacibacter sp.]
MNLFRNNKSKQEQPPAKDNVANEKMLYKIYSVTETGPVRETNEDAICFAYPRDNYGEAFAMVADGMGGHNAGEVASKIACDIVVKLLDEKANGISEKLFLANALDQANKAISLASRENKEYHGMGTTAVLLFIKDAKASYAHVGDSRLYLHSNNSLQQLTTDHTLVNQLVQDGEITLSESYHHSMKNIITQALGNTGNIQPGAGSIEVNAGDKFLLCSDGVNDVISNEELEAIIGLKYPRLALETIKALCILRQTSDNFSAIMVVAEQDYSNGIAITKEQNVML